MTSDSHLLIVFLLEEKYCAAEFSHLLRLNKPDNQLCFFSKIFRNFSLSSCMTPNIGEASLTSPNLRICDSVKLDSFLSKTYLLLFKAIILSAFNLFFFLLGTSLVFFADLARR